MCAERTTYSFFRGGSLPGNLPITLADSTSVVSTFVTALIETASGNRGSGLRSLPSSAISAKVWPEPANNFSALAGFTIMESFSPSVSFKVASASSMLGCARFSDMRDHGISIEAGFGNVTTPSTPAFRSDFGREVDARVEERVFAESEGLAFSVADKCDAGVLLDNLAHLEFHGLIVAVAAGRLDAIGFELLDDVGFSALQSGAAGLAAF